MKISTLIEATDQSVKAMRQVQPNSSGGVSICASGLSGSEEVVVEFAIKSNPDLNTDADWETLTCDGDDVVLSVDDTCITLYGSLYIRISKPATSASVAVILHRA